ncbi:glycosyltransferase family 32 protein [Paraprevotella clara]|jgi:hypothetical protein|uniref:glycosyltransferase family 32 protein n=1 Tax=Paraprevotella clara TaxID=454154 RepID=UPI00307BDEDC
MIPKVIHYCWFGGGRIPAYLQECIDSWSAIMPNYKIKCWTEDNFDVNQIRFVKEAYDNRKFAFVSDYVRIYALYKEGGIYLDTDVIVKKKFDDFLNWNFVSAVEWHEDLFERNKSNKMLDSDGKRLDPTIMDVVGCGILAAVIMSTRGCPLLKDILEYYESQSFIQKKGSFNQLVSPAIFAVFAENYGFRYKNEEQHFGDGYAVYSSEIFALKETASSETVALHIGNGSWIEDVTLKKKVSRFLKKNKLTNFLYKKIKGQF